MIRLIFLFIVLGAGLFVGTQYSGQQGYVLPFFIILLLLLSLFFLFTFLTSYLLPSLVTSPFFIILLLLLSLFFPFTFLTSYLLPPLVTSL